ncbi:MAG: hypothetical protein J0I09_03865 [Sphingobacteriia bacterium]|nr:hypothetical protein [Sphingobacteriia bacterium]
MRNFILLAITIMVFSCAGKKIHASQSNILDGTWLPIQQEIAGTSIPAAAFQKQKLIIKDSTYTFSAESIDKGIARYHDGKMDIYGKEGVNNGRHFSAIYQLSNGQLLICYNLAGDAYPDSFDTKGKAKYFLCMFKKE